MTRWLKRSFILISLIGLVTLNVLTMTLDVANSAFSRLLNTVGVASVSNLLHSKIRHNKADFKQVKNNNLKLRAENQVSKSKISNQKTELIQAKEANSKLRAENKASKSKIGDQKAELNQKKRTNAKLRRMNKNLNVRINGQKSKIKKVGKNIRLRTLKSAAANIGSMPGEAIPILGWSVVIAATTYELKLACDNINEIDELYKYFGLDDRAATEEVQSVCNPKMPSKIDLIESLSITMRNTKEKASELPDGFHKMKGEFMDWLSKLISDETREKQETLIADGSSSFWDVLPKWAQNIVPDQSRDALAEGDSKPSKNQELDRPPTH